MREVGRMRQRRQIKMYTNGWFSGVYRPSGNLVPVTWGQVNDEDFGFGGAMQRQPFVSRACGECGCPRRIRRARQYEPYGAWASRWFDNSFLVAGETFSITASGKWTLDNTFSLDDYFGPDGTTLYGSAILPGIGSVLFGTLMGQIGSSGPYFVVGSSFSGVAGASGELFLRVLDNDFSNNAGFVTAVITIGDTEPMPSPVPLPAGVWLGLTGVAALVAARRRKA